MTEYVNLHVGSRVSVLVSVPDPTGDAFTLPGQLKGNSARTIFAIFKPTASEMSGTLCFQPDSLSQLSI